MGGERKPVMIVGLISLLIGIAGGIHLLNVAFGLCLFFGGTWIFRWMGQKDPFFFDVLLRHVKQQDYYPANSTIDGQRKPVVERD